jgi:mannitol/fructose-specific phosphotransferase system IIA component (Ntr-type)
MNPAPFHLSIPVPDLDRARAFYGEILGCAEGRSAQDRIDFDFFGHHLVVHVEPTEAAHHTAVVVSGGYPTPVRHFGVIVDRERLMSTGIGNGVALPHGKSDVVDESIAAVATLASPIDYDSLDDKPVSIIILLVGPEGSVGLHLRLLSRISRMVGSEQFRSSLLTAKSAADVLALFSGNEEAQG